MFVITFGAWVFINDHSAVDQEYNITQSEKEAIAVYSDSVARGIARFYNIPILGDVITCSTLVSVIPSISFNTNAARPCANPVTAIGAVFVFAATLSCLMDILQIVLNKFSLRNIFFTICIALACIMDVTISEFFPQFTFGFVIIIVLHMIRFLEAAFGIFADSDAVRSASVIEERRYPDYDEMQSYMEGLNGISNALKTSNNLVIYIGDEVVRETGCSLSNLSLFKYEFMWNILPGFAKRSYRKNILDPIAHRRNNPREKSILELVNNIHARNGCNVTVITECVDGHLKLHPFARLIELRGNVEQLVCNAGHLRNVSVNDQVKNETQTCDECGLPLYPTVRIGEADAAAVNDALGIIDRLYKPSGAMLVLGSCENAIIQNAMSNKRINDEVPLMQINSGSKMNNADPYVPAKPLDVLFEVADELDA